MSDKQERIKRVRLVKAFVQEPRTGKSTLAREADELIGKHDWSGASAEVATWFEEWLQEHLRQCAACRAEFGACGGEPL